MANHDWGKQLDKVAKSLPKIVEDVFNNALLSQQPVAIETVARLRRLNPEYTPEQLIKKINKIYISSATASGAAAGIVAVVPNGVVQVPAALADLAVFLESSVLYVLTLAEIYNVDAEDFERRKFLVMTALLGDTGAKQVVNALGKKTIPYWAKTIINKIPMHAIQAANKVLGSRFIAKYGTKQGVLVLGKQIPFGLGAAVGAGSNAFFGYAVMKTTKKILSTPPADWEKNEHEKE